MSELQKYLEEIENKSNNDILLSIKQLQADHEAIKLKMLSDYDKMVEIEKMYEKANQILLKRLRGDK